MRDQIILEPIEDLAMDDQNTENLQMMEVEINTPLLPNLKESPNKFCVFGTCLDLLMSSSSDLRVPFVVSRLCRYIEKYGLNQQRLFKETDKNSVVEELKKEFNEFGDAALESSGNVPAASILLKLFFKELPEPLIPSSMQCDFLTETKDYVKNSRKCVINLKHLVDQLPCSAFSVLKYLSHFLSRLAKHGEANGLNCTNLGIIFGPIIFRSVLNDPEMCIMTGSITHHFVADYEAIFCGDLIIKDKIIKKFSSPLEDCSQFIKEAPLLPSAVMLDFMKPLKVVIPPADDNLTCVEDLFHTPVLMIENSSQKSVEIGDLGKATIFNEDNLKTNGLLLPNRRKRKEALLIEKPLAILSSFKNLPLLPDLLKSDDDNPLKDNKIFYRDFDTHEKNAKPSSIVLSEGFDLLDCYVHPPDPKRRELDSSECLQHPQESEINFLSHDTVFYDNHPVDRNSEKGDKIIVDNFSQLFNTSLSEADIPMDSKESQMTKQSSLSVSDGDGLFTNETSAAVLDWNSLFNSEEPIPAQHYYTFSSSKENEVDMVCAQNNQFSSFEAPLSPSAYRSYLSHRSSYLDARVAPSPPIDQEHFKKRFVKDDAAFGLEKQLTKKIHALKKKIWTFEEKYESEYGYKPSHAEKLKFSEGKKLLNDLHKAKKELKALREEAHLMPDLCAIGKNWPSAQAVHILEDTTNYLVEYNAFKTKPSVADSFEETLKTLTDSRKYSKRPEVIEQMTDDQIKDEKLAIQKVLLQFESIHGKPSDQTDRNTVRPLYDRYHNVKRLLVKSSSFPVYTKGTHKCLQPIMEHETMDFSAQSEKHFDKGGYEYMSICEKIDDFNLEGKNLESSQSLDTKYNNSNLHELPLPEMVSQQRYAHGERRKLRKILREFEAEFFRINGRKIQKDDKALMEALYAEYKLVKARVKLLEALISKHHEHILI